MKEFLITEIQNEMQSILDNGQMEQLHKVLSRVMHFVEIVKNEKLIF